MSKTSKITAWFHSVSGALFDPLVVVTAMTAASLIMSVLAFAGVGISKKVLSICIGIAVVGLITILYQVRRLYRLDMARQYINELLVEGQALTMEVQNTCDRKPKGEEMISSWCTKVEAVLRKYLTEAYVVRFHQGGSSESPKAMTAWKNTHRLETLAGFLSELK